jgi:hypothetical protein
MADKAKPKGEGTVIAVDFSENKDLLAKIRQAAKDDDRPVAQFLRRFIMTNFK